MVTGQMEPGWGEGQSWYTSGHGLSLRVLSVEPNTMQMQRIISKHLDQKSHAMARSHCLPLVTICFKTLKYSCKINFQSLFASNLSLYFWFQKSIGSGLNPFRMGSENSRMCQTLNLNHWSGSGQGPNPNHNLGFGPVWFGFGPRFGTKPSHHYM
jgi:hypothetical protein